MLIIFGQPYGDPSLIDAELGILGYLEVDADQWGASYRHQHQAARRLELDELPEDPGLLRLVLSHGDLTERQALATCDELERLYATLASRFSCMGERDRCPYASAGRGLDPRRAQPEGSFA